MAFWLSVLYNSASQYIYSSTYTVTPGIKGCCFFVTLISSFIHTNGLKDYNFASGKYLLIFWAVWL